MRHSSACQTCRSRKKKCRITRGTGEGPCDYCRYAKVKCSLQPPLKNTRGNTSESSPEPPTRAVLIRPLLLHNDNDPPSTFPPGDVCKDLISVYFDTLDHTENALFHRASFVESFEQDRLPRSILLAVFALGARFSDHSYFEGVHRWERGRQWGEEAKGLFSLQNMDVSLTSIQLCHLLGSLADSEADVNTAALCSAIENRIFILLDLPRHLSTDILQREIEIRVWSSVYMRELWRCACKGGPTRATFNLEAPFPWPMEEVQFQNLREGDVTLADNSLSGITCLWAQMMPLADLFSQIHDLNRLSTGPFSEMSDSCVESVTALAGQLNAWESALPARLRETEENLAYFAEKGLGRVFIALHVGFHYHQVLLHFRFLHLEQDQDTPGEQNELARRCKRHAASISELMWSGNEHYNSRCVWLIIGHVLVVSSVVHLHTLLLGLTEEAVSQARRLLEHNFQLLTSLQEYWPWLTRTMSRLHLFQEACLQTQQVSDIFRMKEGLLKFLLNHNAVITSDDLESLPPTPNLFGFGSELDFDNFFRSKNGSL